MTLSNRTGVGVPPTLTPDEWAEQVKTILGNDWTVEFSGNKLWLEYQTADKQTRIFGSDAEFDTTPFGEILGIIWSGWYFTTPAQLADAWWIHARSKGFGL